MYGYLIYEDDEPTRVALGRSGCTIGSDNEAVIKLIGPEIEPIHCEINVTDDGLASLICNSQKIEINGRFVGGHIYLIHNDEITIMGKRFKYENEYIPPAIVQKAVDFNHGQISTLIEKYFRSFGPLFMTPDTAIMKNAIQMNPGETSTSNDCEAAKPVKIPVAEEFFSQSLKGELVKPVEIGINRKRESTSTCEDEAPTGGRRGKQAQQEIDGEIDMEVDETPSSTKKP